MGAWHVGEFPPEQVPSSTHRSSVISPAKACAHGVSSSWRSVEATSIQHARTPTACETREKKQIDADKTSLIGETRHDINDESSRRVRQNGIRQRFSTVRGGGLGKGGLEGGRNTERWRRRRRHIAKITDAMLEEGFY
eukprot:750119-Hanusia_phi.AAC.3